MRVVLVTGAAGFLGRNLAQALGRRDIELRTFDLCDPRSELRGLLARADVVYHLAGVNRSERIEAFTEVNLGITEELVRHLEAQDRTPLVVFASSTQVDLDNAYGISKRLAEQALEAFARRTRAPVRVYRLPGVFGKWCRPNYNSVVATFCHNTARGLPIEISDPVREVTLVHVQDVVDAFVGEMDCDPAQGLVRCDVAPIFKVELATLAGLIRSFFESRRTLLLPDMDDAFQRRLYSTYVSYLPPDGFAYDLEQRQDTRGSLAELVKQPRFGQIFVSRTRPGVTRGNHLHDVKVEKFCVLEGEAVISFLSPDQATVLNYPVSGKQFRVVDIPPGYAHSITNTGSTDLVVLFWACDIFDPVQSDTHPRQVTQERP